MNTNINIVVLYGGASTEREVSLNSGQAVYKALKNLGFSNVRLLDFYRKNIKELFTDKPDIVFLALHGKGGEDGCVQGMLESLGIPYTGSGVASSAICMNKVYTKQILSSVGIPTARFISRYKCEVDDLDDFIQELIQELNLPMVLKSPCQGSSIGVFIARNELEMRNAILQIFEMGNQLLAEEFLNGIEITLPIIGNDTITVMPDIEIVSENDFYDYEAKYTKGLCEHIIPARIGADVKNEISEIAKRVYREFNCRGIARIDLIIDYQKGPMVIEVNTLPGMTETSLVPDSARAMGMRFEDLVLNVLELGMEEHRKV